MTKEELATKKIALLGLGIEGLSTVTYFLKHNIGFSILDEKSEEELVVTGKEWESVLSECKNHTIPMYLGNPLTSEQLQEFDVVVKSPGISRLKPYLQGFHGEITSQTKLFFDWCKGKVIGVTGTKGKGTTSSLIYEMLKKAGKDVYLGGNIGKPALDFVDDLTERSFIVLELSSFQLQDTEKSPHIAVMLMVTSEHLEPYGNRNYHTNIEEYHQAKRNILRFQTAEDMAVLNTDYEATKSSAFVTPAKVMWVSRYNEVDNGCFVKDNKVILRSDGVDTEIIDTSDILLPGKHNHENVCAAVMVAHKIGVSIDDIVSVLKTFKGLEHRLELVRELGGVRYYDDSIATSPESALAAIQAFSQPKILILGGTVEGSDFTEFTKYVAQDQSVKAIVGIGKEWPMIKEGILSFEENKEKIKMVEGFTTMKEIVQAAKDLAAPGDIVLLSPACKSYDMFKSYKDRGEQFKREVNNL